MDQDTRLCKKCSQFKIRIHNGYFMGGAKKMVDEHGKLWNGRTCPECKTRDCAFIMTKARVRKRGESVE